MLKDNFKRIFSFGTYMPFITDPVALSTSHICDNHSKFPHALLHMSSGIHVYTLTSQDYALEAYLLREQCHVSPFRR